MIFHLYVMNQHTYLAIGYEQKITQIHKKLRKAWKTVIYLDSLPPQKKQEFAGVWV